MTEETKYGRNIRDCSVLLNTRPPIRDSRMAMVISRTFSMAMKARLYRPVFRVMRHSDPDLNR